MKKRVFIGVSIFAALIIIAIVIVTAVGGGTENAVASVLKTRQVADTVDVPETDYTTEVYNKMLTVESNFENMVEGEDYTADQIILAYASEEERLAIESTLEDSGASLVDELMDGVVLVKVPEGSSTKEYYQTLQDELGTVAAQPNYIYSISDTGSYDIDGFLEEQAPRYYKGEKEGSASSEEDATIASTDVDDVDYVTEPEQGTAKPNDALISNEWYLDAVDAFSAWDNLSGFSSGSGVTVAIVDTGIQLRHPDLYSSIVGGVCFTGENRTGQDNQGHGTQVAGIVAAEANNSKGVAGVAPGAKLLAVKVLDKTGSGTSDNIIKGINYAVVAGADVINMSFSSPTYDALLDTAISNAVNSGVVVVCAAGNDASSDGSWPADCKDAISVSSTGLDGAFSSFSNYGEATDIAAPGESMISTTYSKTYSEASGTSMSSPVVAGVVALMLQADSSLSVSEVKDVLYQSADDLGQAGKDIYYGNGVVNANKAVMLVLDVGEQDNAYAISNAKEVVSAIDYDGDIDWFSYTSGSDSDILMLSEGLDSQSLDINIYSEDMNVAVETTLAQDQEYTFSAAKGETYYISVQGATGEYSLVTYQDVVGDTEANAKSVVAGESTGSYIESPDDMDVYEVQTEANTNISINLNVNGDTKSAQMMVEDTSGNRLYTGSESDAGDTFDILNTEEGSYLVYVSASTSLSPYSLVIEEDTNGDSFASAVSIGVSEKISGTLETSDDIDYFVFVPSQTRSYYFNSTGDTDVAVVLYSDTGTKIDENDDIVNPDNKNLYYYNCGISKYLEAGKTYYFALQSFYGDRGDYSVSMTTYDPNVTCSIPDASLQNFFERYYALTDGSQVQMSVMLMTDYIAVKNMKNTTNVTLAENLETLYVYNSPTITDLSVFGNLQYLEYAIFNNTKVEEFPRLIGWNSVKYFEISDSEVTELPDWSASSNLLKVDVTGNYIDFSDGSASAVNEATMQTAGIEVVRNHQESLGKVTITCSNAKPKAYEDITITAKANSKIIEVGDSAEYKFEARYNNGDWETISDWGEDTITWYADGRGSWRIRVSARVGGNENDEGVKAVKSLSVANPAPIDLGRVKLTGISRSVISAGEAVTLGVDVDLVGIPERYALEYRVLYSTNGGSFTTVTGFGWDDYPEAGLTEIEITPPTPITDARYRYVVELRVKGVTTATLFDRSNIERVTSYAIMPLKSVTLTSVGDTEGVQVLPVEGITLTADSENMPGYKEKAAYQFSYRKQGSKSWVVINEEYTTNHNVQFLPETEGIYYFKVTAMSSGRTTVDTVDYDYRGYTLYKNAESAKAVYNLTSGKKDYVNGQMVTLTMDIATNSDGDAVEYQLWYSTNNKEYVMLEDYQPMSMVLGEDYDAIVKVPVLPIVAKDTIYYIKVMIRTEGRTSAVDASAVTQVEMLTAYPVEDGEIGIVSVGNTNQQQRIGTGITLYATHAKDVEYRFAYQKYGTDKWAYVNAKWSKYRSIVFKPKNDGQYKFRVEARSKTRTTIDTVSEETDYYGLYKSSLGVQKVEASLNADELVNNSAGNDVDLTFSVDGNGIDQYEVQISYSTNGRSYRRLPGYEWDLGGPESVVDAVTSLTLPSVRRDTTYYIRVEARTKGHTLINTYDVCEVDVYMVDPLTSIDSFTSDAVLGKTVLVEKTDGLTLTAVANDDATYKFYYRLEGTKKWRAISARYTNNNQAFFRPRTEGTYEFMVKAASTGRNINRPDVTKELGQAINFYFVAEPALDVTTAILDEDADYIIGTETEMDMGIIASGNDAGMEYRVLYSVNGGKTYRPLNTWQTLTTASNFDGMVTTTLPATRIERTFYMKTQVRTIGRTSVDAQSEPVVVSMLAEEREVTTELVIDEDVYEYTDTIPAHIAISEPASGTVEYRLVYSTNGRNWYGLSAHPWTEYDDSGTGSIDVNLNLVELSGKNNVTIRLKARIEGNTKIEDYSDDSFELYNIAPVQTAELAAVVSDEEYITLTTTTDDGGYNKVKEYRYAYAMAGKRTNTWVYITSWVTADEITFTPSDSGDYKFRVQVRSQGRSGIDAKAFADNAEDGYYLASLEDVALLQIEEEASASPSASPSVSPSASAEASPSAEASADSSASISPSASPSASAADKPDDISSLEYAQLMALGEEAKISDYTETEVLMADVLSIIMVEDAPVVVVQLGEDVYAVITGYALDETNALVGLTLTDQNGETILGGTEDILRAWYYTAIEPEAAASVTPELSTAPEVEAEEEAEATPTPTVTPDAPTPEVTAPAPAASASAKAS
ncbi:MAG: S8 family serine peptidase [Eubacteriales bacterium]